MKTGLLIIDVQQALCRGEWAAFEADRVIDRINVLSAKARSAGAPVFLIQHEEEEGPFRHDAPGWQIADGLVTAPQDLRVRKTTCDSFHKTDLLPLVQAHGVTRLVACGLQSDFCVDTTVRRALALGFPVVLPADAHSTLDNGVLTAAQISAHHNETLRNMSSFGPRVKVVPAAEVMIEA